MKNDRNYQGTKNKSDEAKGQGTVQDTLAKIATVDINQDCNE